MSGTTELDEKLCALREQFDHSFAVAAAAGGAEELDFLTIRIAGDPYAIRLSEVASLHADRKLVAVPSPLPELFGIAGFRGILTPVYALGPLLGYPTAIAAKWLVVVQWPSPIALGFEHFDAHLRVPADRVLLETGTASGAVTGAVRDGRRAVPLLHLPSLVAGIARRIKALGPSQER